MNNIKCLFKLNLIFYHKERTINAKVLEIILEILGDILEKIGNFEDILEKI